MSKRILFFIALVCALPPLHSQEKVPASKQVQLATQPSAQPTITISKVVVQAEDTPKGYWTRLLSPENLPNLLLFLVGAAGVWVAVSTLKTIKRQTKATEDSVELAEKVMLLQFRPRVSLRGGFISGLGGTIASTEKRTFQFVVVNEGGSNARIYKSGLVIEFQDPESPNANILANAASIGEFTLKPGEGKPLSLPISDTVAARLEMEFAAYKANPKAFISFVFFVGNIWYKDDLQIVRSTGVCRKFIPQFLSFKVVEGNGGEFST
jgi:hypothetical protein